eukprot:jgi/Chrzof1/13423/Cz07g32140.t1
MATRGVPSDKVASAGEHLGMSVPKGDRRPADTSAVTKGDDLRGVDKDIDRDLRSGQDTTTTAAADTKATRGEARDRDAAAADDKDTFDLPPAEVLPDGIEGTAELGHGGGDIGDLPGTGREFDVDDHYKD